jgi:hypothetical protein
VIATVAPLTANALQITEASQRTKVIVAISQLWIKQSQPPTACSQQRATRRRHTIATGIHQPFVRFQFGFVADASAAVAAQLLLHVVLLLSLAAVVMLYWTSLLLLRLIRWLVNVQMLQLSM